MPSKGNGLATLYLDLLPLTQLSFSLFYINTSVNRRCCSNRYRVHVSCQNELSVCAYDRAHAEDEDPRRVYDLRSYWWVNKAFYSDYFVSVTCTLIDCHRKFTISLDVYEKVKDCTEMVETHGHSCRAQTHR